MNTNVSILTEIPEELHKSLQTYLDAHPNWDQDRVFAAALSLFLLQNNNQQNSQATEHYQACAKVYLETLFET